MILLRTHPIDTDRLSSPQLSWCELVANMTSSERPSVLSISWGSGESTIDKSHMTSATACFQKLGLQGISIFAASGDVGTGKQGGFFSCKKFDPEWPAACPYVTAVGGTSPSLYI
jgi:tripeptidyl-peptidase-1